MKGQKFFYTRGKCEGDVSRVWIGTRAPYRAVAGRSVTYYPEHDCLALFTVHSPAEFQRIFGHRPLLPDNCIELKSLTPLLTELPATVTS